MHFGISEAVSHWGRYKPDNPALYYNGKVVTYKEFDLAISFITNCIAESDFKNNRIGLAVKSKYHFLISLLAILTTGKSVVLLNTGLPFEAVKTNIEDTETKIIIHDYFFENIAQLSNIENSINIEKRIQTIKKFPERPSFYTSSMPTDEWGVLFSSGTTGIPKGIVRDHYSMVIEILGWCIELQLNRKTTFYVGRPIFYTGGLVLSLSTLLVGGSIFINDYRDYNDSKVIWLDYQRELAKASIDWAFFVPDQIREFVRICTVGSQGRSKGAKTLLVMGAPISGEEKVQAAKVLESQIVESWGNSESLGTITDPEDIQTRPNSIGRPFLTDELFIIDDNREILEPEKDGRLAGGEEASFNYYCNRPDETKKVKQNRLIISDDLGYMDKDGYFYVLGRQQDCVLIDKKTVYLTSIEMKIKKSPNIQDCVVIAHPLNESKIELVGVIAPLKKKAVNAKQLRKSLNSVLKSEEKLSRVLFVNTLPKLPSGKINKLKIKEMVTNK